MESAAVPAVQKATQGIPRSLATSAEKDRKASVRRQVALDPRSATTSSNRRLKFPGVTRRKSSTLSKGLPENTWPSGAPSAMSYVFTLPDLSRSAPARNFRLESAVLKKEKSTAGAEAARCCMSWSIGVGGDGDNCGWHKRTFWMGSPPAKVGVSTSPSSSNLPEVRLQQLNVGRC
ncbi:phospholipase D LlSicTox-alphaIII3ii [Striga asiatica]|uniref:Phospholipase D LlSicTox-alphaIII3ii n=1 Tax=Striga asiatica TaxID=4170 RepID=A0A5A7P5S4_STRAF|nr:phospholipase D LlSicTox-alphaIII3ii [Striga asiatica]